MGKGHMELQVLNGATLCALVKVLGDHAALSYIGPKFYVVPSMAELLALEQRERVPGAPDVEAPISLLPTLGQGWPGHPGLSLHRAGRDWALVFTLEDVRRDGEMLHVSFVDTAARIRVTHHIGFDVGSDVLTAWNSVENLDEGVVDVAACAALTLPVPDYLTHIHHYEGRWALEYQMQCLPRSMAGFVKENRRGRTSHDSFPAVLLEDAQCSEASGDALALHLGWSGNHRISVETLEDGRAYAQLGELLHPGEIRLAKHERYESPKAFVSASDTGRNGLMQRFQSFVRHKLLSPSMRRKPRPVHYNSWEALYFDLSLPALLSLLDEAADVGAERFVLDDGWFKGRRNDRAGLGDWYVDKDIFPDGLMSLFSAIQARGMECGLWVEPEMVNADSDLYRAHSDWVLSGGHAPQIPYRNQFALDMRREDVRAYLFERLDELLSTYPISYLKWDMNRDIFHPGSADGRIVMHDYVKGVYALIDAVRAKHPHVEIEDCSSGGARADYAIVSRTDRIWTSDCNDAMDRLSIQKGFMRFFPAEIMGSHIGPAECHITKRRLPMETRAAVAFFGHMGMEVDLRQESAAEKAVLKQAIALHKQYRAFIHDAVAYRLDTTDVLDAFMLCATDGTEALISCAQLETQRTNLAGRLRLLGLDARARYRVSAIWPQSVRFAREASGEALMRMGFELPRLTPQSVIIFHAERVLDV